MEKEIMKLLQDHVDKMDNKYDNKKLSKRIYERIKHTEKESKSIQHDYQLHDITNRLQTSRFVDKKIATYAQTHLHYQYDIHFHHKNIDFFVHIMYGSKSIDVEKYIQIIKWVIVMCLYDIKNETKETMNLNLYLTPLKKSIPIDFPNTILPYHINSGYSSHNPSMEIHIFREEEWVKVLIHECFHAFDMDFHEEKINFANLFQSTFFVKSDFQIYESFVEFWSRILNCALFTYQVKSSLSQTEFHTLFTLNLNIERIFSLIQATKLLKLFHLTYGDVVNKEKKSICKKIYKENTNAFCYYVITSIMMNYFDKTLEWFDVHNTQLFYFDKSERQVVIFCHYIKQLASNPKMIELYDTLNVTELKKVNPMKMCVFEIIV